jgi:hypothetical protein
MVFDIWQAVSSQTLSRDPTIAPELVVSRIHHSPRLKAYLVFCYGVHSGVLQCKYSKNEKYHQNIVGGREGPKVMLLVVSRESGDLLFSKLGCKH